MFIVKHTTRKTFHYHLKWYTESDSTNVATITSRSNQSLHFPQQLQNNSELPKF